MSLGEDRPSSVGAVGEPSPALGLGIGRSVDDYRLSGVSLRHSGDEGEPVFEMRMPASAAQDDQVRRNHTVQYVAYPDYCFDRLRQEAPERYETYADITIGRWIGMRLVVLGGQVRLCLDGRAKAAFLVSGMKLGAE